MTDYEPMFSCQMQRCAEEISYPAEALWVHNGEPICEGCCSEDNSIPSVCDLPPFVPAYQAEITRLNQEIDALHAEIGHRKAGGHEWPKINPHGQTDTLQRR